MKPHHLRFILARSGSAKAEALSVYFSKVCSIEDVERLISNRDIDGLSIDPVVIGGQNCLTIA